MKTNLDQFFKTDKALEKDGVWFDISSDIGFLVRPFKQTNPRVKAAMANHYKPYARQIELNSLDLAKQFEINIKIFIDVCLVEWKGVEADGKPLELTTENAIKFFTGLPDLFDTLWKHSTDFTNYKEDLGNS